jgi:hypothetical protein
VLRGLKKGEEKHLFGRYFSWILRGFEGIECPCDEIIIPI